MFGNNGKILRVDLSTRRLHVEEPDEVFYRTYFGGTNFVANYLLKELRPGVDPLGPENKLIFATGPLTGAPLAGSGRNSVGAKSPLTGGFGDSQAGGYFGAELKHAGFDAVIVEGQCAQPVYLLIVDGKAELRDASHLWGQGTAATEAAIRQETGEKLLRTAAIGPAGENLVRYACVMNDVKHAAGRTGVGAVMGSKRLKAVAVRGRGGPAMADPEKVRALGKWAAQNWMNINYGMHDAGTARSVLPLSVSGALPTRNFREGSFECAEAIGGEKIRDTILVGRGTCYACAMRCKRKVRVGPPWNVDPVYGGPEYETVAALGSCCGVGDLGAIAKANELCNAYGLDSISTGVSIAFAMECFENGLLTKRDTDGLQLAFGNAEAMVQMVERIALRRGLGDLLAEGVKRAAQTIGGSAAQYAMHVKGQELPMHEPRTKPGVGVGYAVSPTGADHVHSMHDTMFVSSAGQFNRVKSLGVLEPLPVTDLSGKKVRLFYYESTWRHTVNNLVVCIFLQWSPAQITELINAATGWNSTALEIFNVGRRSLTMPRLFNLREGFTSEDDVLPARLFEKFTSGPAAGAGAGEAELRQMIATYYQMVGWNEAGVPTPGHLAELDLGWAAPVPAALARA